MLYPSFASWTCRNSTCRSCRSYRQDLPFLISYRQDLTKMRSSLSATAAALLHRVPSLLPLPSLALRPLRARPSGSPRPPSALCACRPPQSISALSDDTVHLLISRSFHLCRSRGPRPFRFPASTCISPQPVLRALHCYRTPASRSFTSSDLRSPSRSLCPSFPGPTSRSTRTPRPVPRM
jgi:hypothetical protein